MYIKLALTIFAMPRGSGSKILNNTSSLFEQSILEPGNIFIQI